jgi:zinc protease
VTIRHTLISAALLVMPVAAFSQAPPVTTASTASLDTRLPVDPKIRIGKLPNGIRYYIRQNSTPRQRAELRLAVNAGSILETDNQLGMAHVVEHTAFNGTTHFAKNELISYLQSVGVRFGADVNAYTSFDETVYMLTVPTDTARIVEKAFTILGDWAHGQVFDSAEVMSERLVVREEWRGRKGAGDRMLQQWLPIAFKGSRYALRLPIGTEQSIMSVTPSKLRAFYNDWYRPDLMALIAVGDFDPAAIEAQIRRSFDFAPAAKAAMPRREYDVPPTKAPLVAIATDREASGTTVNLTFKIPAKASKTLADYRDDLTGQLYLQMLNARLDELTQKPNAPFLAAGASKDNFFARSTEAFSIGARVNDGGVERGLEGLLTEARRVAQFGFLQAELDRARQNLLRAYERAYAERDKSQSASLADEYVRNFLEDEPIPGIAYEYELARRFMTTVTLDDLNRLSKKWMPEENRVIVVQTPIKTGVTVPTESAILAAFDRVSKLPVTAYAESVTTEALLATLPQPGKIVSSRPIPSIGAVEWKLSNGARVFVKATDFKDDQILFAASSPGGSSLAPDANVMSAIFAEQIASLGGLGSLNRIDLVKRLSGKSASVDPDISETTEGFNGSTSPKDLETMLQLLYLEFTAPRLDTAAFAVFRAQGSAFVANRGTSPEAVFSDTVQVTLEQHSPRARPLTPTTFAEIDARKALDFYKDRFADAGDFTFAFVGNVDTTSLKPYVERYLASLPSRGRKETFVDRGPSAPRGVIQKTVRKGVEPKANTLIVFTGSCSYSPETRFRMRALTALMQIRLTESLREKLGGTYSPNVGGGCQREPKPEYAIQIQFGSSPENVELLNRAALALIDTLKNQGPTPADIEKVKEQILRSREVDVRQNSYWVSNILARDAAGEDLGGLAEKGPYDEMVKKLSAADIRAAAKLYLDTANYARFVLVPEKTQAKSGQSQ